MMVEQGATPDGEMLSATYEIPDPNFKRFQDGIENLAKRAEKLGLPPVGFRETGTSFRKSRKSAGFEPTSFMVHHVEVFGERPNIKGWRFIGKLEHIPGTNDVVLKEMNDGDIPDRYKSCDPNCDHCKTNRNRKDTFIIRNSASGEYMQIGRSCLSDYFGGQDPELVAKFFEHMQEAREMLRDLEDWDEEGGISPRGMYYDPERILAFAAAAVREDRGYVSARDAEERGMLPTAQLVRANMTMPPKQLSKGERLNIIEQDNERAREIFSWLKSDAVATKEETYFHNLRVMANASTVSYKNIGLFASAVAAYAREQARELEKEAAQTSRHIGTKGEKIEMKVTLTAIKVIPGHFGDKLLHTFIDQGGNRLVWFCSGMGCHMIPGQPYHIRATIKQHEEYRGAQQTALERVTCPDMKIFDLIKQYDGDLKTFTKKLKAIHDIDVKESRFGRTPLLEAVIYEHEEIAKELIKAGADLDAKDSDGNTTKIARPEIYERLRNEALARDWIAPPQDTSYGFIRCEASSLDMLRSFGIQPAPYDHARRGVMAEAPIGAEAELERFPADFDATLTVPDPLIPASQRPFYEYFHTTAQDGGLASLWAAKLTAIQSDCAAETLVKQSSKVIATTSPSPG